MCSFQTLEVPSKKMAAARSPLQLALNATFPLVGVLHLVVPHPHRIQVHQPLQRLHLGPVPLDLAHLGLARLHLALLGQGHLRPTALPQPHLQWQLLVQKPLLRLLHHRLPPPLLHLQLHRLLPLRWVLLLQLLLLQ